MKNDTQHLDFLISQYMDGCLDPSSKKSLEQKIVNDPQARNLYKEQREVQDVLDDWGNRIPLINWEQFDKKLSDRLQHETVGGHGASMFRRWSRAIAVAAGLFLAASVGYAWHAWSNPGTRGNIIVEVSPTATVPVQNVRFDEAMAPRDASLSRFKVDEPAALGGTSTKVAAAQISSPDDVAATKALEEAVRFGMGADVKRPGSANAMDYQPKKDDSSKESPPALPFP